MSSSVLWFVGGTFCVKQTPPPFPIAEQSRSLWPRPSFFFLFFYCVPQNYLNKEIICNAVLSLIFFIHFLYHQNVDILEWLPVNDVILRCCCFLQPFCWVFPFCCHVGWWDGTCRIPFLGHQVKSCPKCRSVVKKKGQKRKKNHFCSMLESKTGLTFGRNIWIKTFGQMSCGLMRQKMNVLEGGGPAPSGLKLTGFQKNGHPSNRVTKTFTKSQKFFFLECLTLLQLWNFLLWLSHYAL